MSIHAQSFFHKTGTHLTKAMCALVMAGLNAPVIAQEMTPSDCLPDWIVEPREIPPSASDPNEPVETQFQANKLSQTDEMTYEIIGDVHLTRPGLVILADSARIDRQTQQANLWGDVVIYRPDMLLTAESVQLQQAQKTAQAQTVEYQFVAGRAHGKANSLKLNQNKQRLELDQATYSTCRLKSYEWQVRDHQDPSRVQSSEKLDWNLDFSELDINNQKRRIYGYHTWLYFQTLPVFYTPYISFPMDERASGILFPVIGSRQPLGKDTSETYIAIPYYINLAPNFDDTLTVIKMQERGFALDNEFRYLGKQGQTDFTLTLVNDELTKREGLAQLDSMGNITYGAKNDQRWRGKIASQQTLGYGFSTDALWHEVSDQGFFNDIPVENNLQNVTQTERYINLNFAQGNLNTQVSLLSYLRLRKDAAYNYEKRPEVLLNYSNSLPGELENFSYALDTQVTEFEVPLRGHAKPEGRRSILKPSISYDYIRSYGNVSAQMVGNKVAYNLQDTRLNTTGKNDHDITLPQFALHGGLSFERDFSLIGRNFIQTLEPEIQYLYTPYQDQSKIPLFDTAKQSLDFSNLFSLNRFSGYDRIGDANQVSAALTTRFLSADGEPLAEAGLGQIMYLADQQVQLTGNTPTTDRVSDYFVKLGATVGPFSFYSTSQYDKTNYELTNANNRLKLDLAPQLKLLLTNTVTNYNKPGEKEEIAAGLSWRMNQQWSLGTYWNYDFTLGTKTEVQHALRYDNCCWASELSVQETQLPNGLYNLGIQYVIELKGLSTVGTTFTDYLNDKLNF